MNPEITLWLATDAEHRDYAAGVALYEQHGTSSVVKRLLAAGSTGYSRGVLEKELAKLVAADIGADIDVRSPDMMSAPMSAPRVVAIIEGKPHFEAPTPEPIAQLQAQRRPWFARRDYLRAQLLLLRSDEERRLAALEILDMADLITQSYDAERHYRQHGMLPAAPVAKEPAPALAALTDPAAILRALNNARSRRSKCRNHPDKLAQVEADIRLLESKLT